MKIFQRLLIALMAAAVLVPAVTACGGDDDTGGSDVINNNENNGENHNNVANNDENNGENFLAAHLLVDVSPTMFTYAVGTQITPSPTVFDETWTELSDVDVDWTVTPEEAVEQDGNRWTVVEPGKITFRACALDQTGQSSNVCGEREITSALGTDRIVLESPQAGQFFAGADHETIPVSGFVDLALNAETVQINGTTIDVDEDGRFSHELTPEFGVNTVKVRAFDGVNPADAIAAASVMWAPAYLEPTVDTDNNRLGASIDQAILLSLGQNFIDDGKPYTTLDESEIVTHDLADILHLVLDNIDIAAELSNPVVDTSALVLNVPDVAINEPRIELDITDEGIELYGQIPDLVAQTEGFIDISNELLSLDGDISARVSIFAAVEVEKRSFDDPFHVELVDFELAVEGATANFASEEANALFELADSMLRDQLEEIILDGIDLSFIETLPELLLDVFNSLDEVIAGQEFALDLDIGDPLMLSFDGGIAEMLPYFGQGLDGFISATLGVDGQPSFPDNPGIPHLVTEVTNSPFYSQSRVQLGLNLALINSILHSLWNAGLLDLNITDLIPANFSAFIESGQAEGKLPPVVAPPTGDSPYDLMLQLGQLELDLGWKEQTDRFGAEIVVGANLTLIGDQISIDIDDEPHIELWLIESTEDEPLLGASDLGAMLKGALWPQIEEAIGDGLGFALPIPALDALEQYAPALANMTLDVRMTRDVDIRQGFLMIDAAIEGILLLP